MEVTCMTARWESSQAMTQREFHVTPRFLLIDMRSNQVILEDVSFDEIADFLINREEADGREPVVTRDAPLRIYNRDAR
jgi:hypothetical protein